MNFSKANKVHVKGLCRVTVLVEISRSTTQRRLGIFVTICPAGILKCILVISSVSPQMLFRSASFHVVTVFSFEGNPGPGNSWHFKTLLLR